MNIKTWLKEAGNQLDKCEFNHLTVAKGSMLLQLKNETTGTIELHQFNYIAKNAENLKLNN